MEYLHKLAIDLENKPSGMPDYFACNVVKLIANGLYRMPLPIVLQGFFEEHKKSGHCIGICVGCNDTVAFTGQYQLLLFAEHFPDTWKHRGDGLFNHNQPEGMLAFVHRMPELRNFLFEVMVFSFGFLYRFPLGDLVNVFKYTTVKAGTNGIGDMVCFAVIKQGVLIRSTVGS